MIYDEDDWEDDEEYEDEDEDADQKEIKFQMFLIFLLNRSEISMGKKKGKKSKDKKEQ